MNDHERNEYLNDFNDNNIWTTKYTKWNFLPLSIIYQFMRLANAYFLMMAILNCIPVISAISPASSIAPLTFVLLVSIIREGIEDYFRWQSDKATNGQRV